jgi:hypothetical protein
MPEPHYFTSDCGSTGAGVLPYDPFHGSCRVPRESFVFLRTEVFELTQNDESAALPKSLDYLHNAPDERQKWELKVRYANSQTLIGGTAP